MMHFMIDSAACTGCGICANACEQTFQMGVDQKAHVRKDPDRDHEDCARTAADDCPTHAIYVM